MLRRRSSKRFVTTSANNGGDGITKHCKTNNKAEINKADITMSRSSQFSPNKTGRSSNRRPFNKRKSSSNIIKEAQSGIGVTTREQREDSNTSNNGLLFGGFFQQQASKADKGRRKKSTNGIIKDADDDERETASKSDGTGSRTSLMSKLFPSSSNNNNNISKQQLQQQQQQHHHYYSANNSNPRTTTADRIQAKVVYDAFGDASVLKVVEEERELSDPKPNNVWIKVQASTVTLHDCLVRHGVDCSILDPHSLPITPGTDVVGHIIKCHRPEELPEEYSLGDRVAAVVKSGANSRFVLVPISNLLQVVPPNLEATDVAAILSHYSVAYQALRAVTTHSRPMLSLHGKNVLMFLYEGLLDGTSQALLQLCKKAKATVYVVAPAARHAYLRNVLEVLPLPAADDVDDDWSSRISSETIDIIFDATAEDVRPAHDEQVQRMEQLLRRNTTTKIVQYGHAPLLRQSATSNVCGAPLSLHWKQALSGWSATTVMENSYRRFQHDPTKFRQDVHTLLQWLLWNKLSPHVSKRLGLGDIGKWHSALANADPSIRGALVVLPWRQISTATATA